MALFSETEERIFGEILFDVVNDTNIRRSSPGSKTRALIGAFSRKLGKIERVFDRNVAIAFLDGASGKYLDFLGDMLGVSRLGEVSAISSSAERNVRFYVETGTFGTINSGSSITIPAGTIVSTGETGTGIQYQVPYTVILPSGESQLYVGVQAIRPGISSNVGLGQIIFHNFNNYTQSLDNTLKVTNDSEILRGQDAESDINYRFRIANQVVATEGSNLVSIRLAALAVPGVADLVLLPFHRGIGTLDILVKSTTPSVPQGLLPAVQEAVDRVAAAGMVNTARGPQETGFSMIATLRTRNRLSASDQTALVNQVTNNMIDYVNSLDIGEEFIVNEAVERVLSTSENIKNVGQANKPFDFLYIYKTSKLEDNKVRSLLIGDYTPEPDERLIVENTFAGATPILFRIAV